MWESVRKAPGQLRSVPSSVVPPVDLPQPLVHVVDDLAHQFPAVHLDLHVGHGPGNAVDVLAQCLYARNDVGIGVGLRVSLVGLFLLSLGLAQGITDETGSVVQGVQDVSDTALSTMMDLAQRVGDIASDDFEYEPSIQPVVDMSDVQNGVDWLNDTLFQNGTVDLNAERTAGLAANVVRRAEVAKAR